MVRSDSLVKFAEIKHLLDLSEKTTKLLQYRFYAPAWAPTLSPNKTTGLIAGKICMDRGGANFYYIFMAATSNRHL
jgi:hypothetical protein